MEGILVKNKEIWTATEGKHFFQSGNAGHKQVTSGSHNRGHNLSGHNAQDLLVGVCLRGNRNSQFRNMDKGRTENVNFEDSARLVEQRASNTDMRVEILVSLTLLRPWTFELLLYENEK